MILTREQFGREWDLLYADHGEIPNYGAYLYWRAFILGETTIDDPLVVATTAADLGYISYYAYQRLYYWIANGGDPDPYVANKYPDTLPDGTKFVLTTSVVPIGSENGVSLVPPGGQYAVGAEVVVTAVATTGYEFSGWSGDATGITNPVTITMDSDKRMIAGFTATGGGADILSNMLPAMIMMMMIGMIMPLLGEMK